MAGIGLNGKVCATHRGETTRDVATPPMTFRNCLLISGCARAAGQASAFGLAVAAIMVWAVTL